MEYRDIIAANPTRIICVENRFTGKKCETPSFVASAGYTENFSKQWSRFRDTQIDSVNGTSISKDFLERMLDQTLDSLEGKTILELGAGAGRFTEYLVRYAKCLVAIDLSEAIFANAALGADNLVAAQADLLHMPPMRLKFDIVFCRGVLQHTPNPVQAIERIHQFAKPGGTVIFDVYRRTCVGRLHYKYLWRPIIRRLFTFESFSEFLDRYAERILHWRWKLKPFLPGKSKYVLSYLFPVWDHKGLLPLTDKQLIEWSKLDTLDAMFAFYDTPLKHKEVIEIIRSLGHELVFSDKRLNFFKVRAHQ